MNVTFEGEDLLFTILSRHLETRFVMRNFTITTE